MPIAKHRKVTLRAGIRGEDGSELVEFSLILLLLMSALFLILDIAWLIFEQGSLQWAVQQGVRYAITSNTLSGKGQDASIKTVVQRSAMGFLDGDAGLSKITVSYYNPADLSKALIGSGSNAGGNVVKVSVDGVTFGALGPIYTDTLTTLTLGANSSDILESSPGGVAPTR